MAKTLSPKVNGLVDKLEDGKLSMRSFVRQVTRLGIPKSGVGALIQKPQPERTLTSNLVRTGVVVRIEEMKGAKKAIVHGAVKPGAVEFAQVVKSASWTLESSSPSMEVAVAGGRETVERDTVIEVKKGQPIRLTNPGKRTVQFVAQQPVWEPKDYSYQYQGQRIAGEEMWFELKTSVADKRPRPMYNVMSAGRKGNFVLVTVEGKSETLRCYYTDGDYIVTGVTGIGKVEVESSNGKMRTENIARGENVKVKKNEVFSIINERADTLVAEIRSVSARYWAPESSYFDVGGKFASGSEVYFEFVIPT
jgi:hypothetical protein